MPQFFSPGQPRHCLLYSPLPGRGATPAHPISRPGYPAHMSTVFGRIARGELSAHRIWEDAAPEVLAATHQTWLRDPATGDYLVDVFREPHDGDTWICRRDDTIRLPYAEIIRHTPDGIPYLAPELVLLFKAKHVRAKDQADFDSVLPRLNTARRRWLSELIIQVHPGHRWLASL